MALGLASPFLPPTLNPGQSIAPPVTIFDDFVTGGTGTTIAHKFATTADAAEWLKTADNSGTTLIADSGHGGWLVINPGTSANDFVSLQLNGEAVLPAAGRQIIFEIKFKTNDADDIKFFVGLATTDVTGTVAGPILDGTNDSIGFRNVLGNTTSFLAIVEDDTTELTASHASQVLADDTFIVLQFALDGLERARFYVNGALTATILPTSGTTIIDSGAAMTPTIEVSSPTGTTATTMTVDYISIVADRV